MEYLEFEVRIGAGSERMYPVTVVHSPAGEVSATTLVPLDDATFRGRLQVLEGARGSAGQARKAGEAQPTPSWPPAAAGISPVEQLGRQLFDILLPTDVRSCYRTSLARAREQGQGLRLRLRIEAPDLAVLPWEYLYDVAEGDYVCLSSETPITRYLELGRPPQPLTVTPPLHILGMIASPSDLQPLDIEREKRQMASAIGHLLEAGYVTLTWLEGQTWLDLQTAMRRGPWHVFHFIGHGGFDRDTGEGLLALADQDGKSTRVNSQRSTALINQGLQANCKANSLRARRNTAKLESLGQ